ncbi:MAG: 16S rRNA (uracil(1498)-N(3))-methyltransferase [Bacteroidia bacterium]|nr:16S rRNA (uracil(1498)-N(3))-methyltransferase [Bacteroidia bacterium]
MFIFYHPEPIEQQVLLGADESHHLARVLRLQKGERVTLFDGRGGVFHGLIEKPDPKAALIVELQKDAPSHQPSYRLHVAIAPTKTHERFEWFLEKATEIGVSQISPLLTKRTERPRINDTRAAKILVSAMKQSKNAFLPKLNPAIKLEQLFATYPAPATYIAHCMPGNKPLLSSLAVESIDILVLIGPEGDFTPDEIEFSTRAGAKEISLGNSRLRTETAGITACMMVALAHHPEMM